MSITFFLMLRTIFVYEWHIHRVQLPRQRRIVLVKAAPTGDGRRPVERAQSGRQLHLRRGAPELHAVRELEHANVVFDGVAVVVFVHHDFFHGNYLFGALADVTIVFSGHDRQLADGVDVAHAAMSGRDDPVTVNDRTAAKVATAPLKRHLKRNLVFAHGFSAHNLVVYEAVKLDAGTEIKPQ